MIINIFHGTINRSALLYVFGFIVFWLVFYLTSIVTGHTKTIMVTVSVEFSCGYENYQTENMMLILS